MFNTQFRPLNKALALCLVMIMFFSLISNMSAAEDPFQVLFVSSKESLDLSKNESTLLQWRVNGATEHVTTSGLVEILDPSNAWVLERGFSSGGIVGKLLVQPKINGSQMRINIRFTDINQQEVLRQILIPLTGTVPEEPEPVYPDPVGPLAFTMTLEKDTVNLGETTVRGSWKITGGTPPYTLSYHLELDESYDDPNLIPSPEPVKVPAEGNMYFSLPPYFNEANLHFNIRDEASGNASQGPFPVTLYDPSPLTMVLKAEEKGLFPGDTAHITWTLTGGQPPWIPDVLIYYSVNDVLSGGWFAATSDTSIDFTVPEEARKFLQVNITVRDLIGRKQFDSLLIPILSSEPMPGDADGNGDIEIEDLQAVIEFLISKVPLLCPGNIDANANNEVDADEILALINLLVQ
ncbi:MAG: hypothetical protein GX540_08005 [Clostridiales bacterium]|nr:hypothetical protein [Clostridiales bacterium]